MKKEIKILSIFALFFLFFLFSGLKVNAPVNKVILIGWDGVQRDHLKESLAKNELPFLTSIIKEGSLVDIDVKGVTDTKAGWSEILTGYGPEKTGVYSNNKYKPISQGYTIFEKLKEFLGKDNIKTAAVIGKKFHVGGTAKPLKVKVEIIEKYLKNENVRVFKNAGIDDRTAIKKIIENYKKVIKNKKKIDLPDESGSGAGIITENNIEYLFIPGEPYYYTYKNLDFWLTGLNQNENVTREAVKYIELFKDMPFFIFVHFADTDSKGHKYGENSKEYNDALISDDCNSGKIFEKLKVLGIEKETLIYITADHGFNEGEKHHKNAPFIFLASNDQDIKSNGTRSSIAPIVYQRFGIDLTKIVPALDGDSLIK